MTPCLLLLLLLSAAAESVEEDAPPPTVHASPAAEPVKLDGRLIEPVWQTAPRYSLALPTDAHVAGDTLAEGGGVQFAYDERFLYVAVRFADSDAVQESDEDQRPHFRTGDVAELFLKPDGATWYWEMYATPNGKRTAYFFPGGGRRDLPSSFDYASDLRVAAEVDGSLNEWHDRDNGWTAEMAVPRAELAAQGVPLSPDHPWRVLVARYNYGRYLDRVELSAWPRLPVTNFHRTESYAPLVLDPAEGAER